MQKLFLMFILAVFMIGGCTLGTTHIPYSAPAPQEKLCTLRIVPTLTVTQFDEEEVKWSGDFATWGVVQIPEGTHTFVLTYSAAHGYQTNIHFTASFLAGRAYSMVAQPVTQTTVRISIVEGVL